MQIVQEESDPQHLHDLLQFDTLLLNKTPKPHVSEKSPKSGSRRGSSPQPKEVLNKLRVSKREL